MFKVVETFGRTEVTVTQNPFPVTQNRRNNIGSININTISYITDGSGVP